MEKFKDREVLEEINNISKIVYDFYSNQIEAEIFNSLIIEKIKLLKILGLTNSQIQEKTGLNVFEFLLINEIKENSDLFVKKIISLLEDREINNYFLKIFSLDEDKLKKLGLKQKFLEEINNKRLEVIGKISKEINVLEQKNNLKNNQKIQELQEFLTLLGFNKFFNSNNY